MPEQEPSRFEAFKQGFSERLDSFKQGINRLKTVGEVAGLGVGISLGLVATAGAEEPVHNTNIPVLEADSFASTSTILNERTSTAATASDAQQDCVDAALKIKVIGSVMSSPGDRRKQAIGTSGKLHPISTDCLTLISRETPKIFFRMQRPNNHKAYIRTKTQPMVDDSDHSPVDGNIGEAGSAFVTASGKGGMKDSHFLYRCTPGKGITHVQAVYKLKVDSAIDGSELGHRSISAPVRIRPVPPSLVQGGGVPKAC